MSAEQEYHCSKCGLEWSVDSLNGGEYNGCPRCAGYKTSPLFQSNIVESNIGGHVIISVLNDNCELCGEEMQDIVFYGVVCTNPECAKNIKKI